MMTLIIRNYKHLQKAIFFFYKALSYYETNDLEYAIKYFEKAKNLFPKEYPRLALPYFYLGKIFEKKMNYKKSVEEYLTFIDINKNEQNYFMYDINYDKANEVYFSISKIYQENENYELSTKYINILIEREPKLPNSYITRGLNYYYKKDLENAKSDFVKSCDLGLNQGCELIEKLRNNNIQKDKIKKSNYITGGFKTNKILEYKYNTLKKEYELISELNIQSKLYFNIDDYFFKRGENKWLYSPWTYQNYDETSQRHFYLDNYGQTITFDKDYKTITWYSTEINNVYQKIIIYTELIEDKTIIPNN